MDKAAIYRTVSLITATAALCASAAATAQVPVDDNGHAIEPVGTAGASTGYAEAPAPGTVLSDTELQELVGPIALYPDDLLAIVLPASTYPLEIVQAARFLEDLENDSSLEPSEDWDESVVALLNYPEVLRMMDEDIDWTWQLGQAVIDQQPDVISAVEQFRDRAYAAGNLKSDEHQEVRYEDDIIEIVPIEDDIIYVPYYEPEEVVVYQPRRVYYYYPQAYPVYYYPYPVGYTFQSGFFWGVTTAFNIGWSSHYLHVYHPTYWGHPYYGYSYYGHYYRRPSVTVYNTTYVNNTHYSVDRYRDGDYWAPRRRAGARPGHYYSDGRHTTYTRSGQQQIRAPRDRDAGSVRNQRRDASGVRTNRAVERVARNNPRIDQGTARTEPRRDSGNRTRTTDRGQERNAVRATRPAAGQPQRTSRLTTDTARVARHDVARQRPATAARARDRDLRATPPARQQTVARAPRAASPAREQRRPVQARTARVEQVAERRQVQARAPAAAPVRTAPRVERQRPSQPARAERNAPSGNGKAATVARAERSQSRSASGNSGDRSHGRARRHDN